MLSFKSNLIKSILKSPVIIYFIVLSFSIIEIYIYKSLDEGNHIFGIKIDLKSLRYCTARYTLQQASTLRNTWNCLPMVQIIPSKTKTIRNYKWNSIRQIRLMRIWSPPGVSPWTNIISFINDINKSLDHIIVKLFADDTNCFISGNNFNQLERLVEVELNKLRKWINANKLTINFNPKNQVIVFLSQKTTLPPNFDKRLNVGTNVLRYKENTKYLGFILDLNLTIETHTKELNQKLVKYTCIFNKIRHFLPVSCRRIVYNAFISSRLNYGSEIYVRTSKRHIQPLAHTALSSNTEQIIKNPAI